MISVEEALARVTALARTLPCETVPLAAAAGRVMAEPAIARLTQPPFAASAMDGYAVRTADIPEIPVALRVVGTSAAGRGFPGRVGPGEAVRIFTGAPVPAGADAIVLQEDAESDGGAVTVRERPRPNQFVRPTGLDFRAGAILLRSGDRLDARRLALAAAAGHGDLPVRRKPRIGILATGDELVRPGQPAGPDQIVASNPYAIAALVEKAGGEAVDLGIAQDSFEALEESILSARRAEADLLVTLGGASVGCGILFLVPAVRALLGDPNAASDPTEPALLGADLPANDGRQDYLRATLRTDPLGLPAATALPKQDSSMLSSLEKADVLLVREPHAIAAPKGSRCRIISLERFC